MMILFGQRSTHKQSSYSNLKKKKKQSRTFNILLCLIFKVCFTQVAVAGVFHFRKLVQLVFHFGAL